MSAIYIVDTSILLNILDVPEWNQNRNTVLADFKDRIEAGSRFHLPVAAIIQTGNHIADIRIRNGHHRRRCAEELRDRVGKALDGQAPWVVTQMPDAQKIRKWLAQFPDYATQELGIANISIIHAWEEACRLNRRGRVAIWSLHEKLAAYDREP